MTEHIRVPLSYNAWLRYDVIQRILSHRFPEAHSFLEVGCGQGALAVRLARHYQYHGFEPDPSSSDVAKNRLAELGKGRVTATILPAEPTGQFDLVGAFEVLEHLRDDLAAVRQWREWLAPAGGLLLSVPAHQHRYSHADSAVGHYRRYSRQDLTALLLSAGYEQVEVIAYAFPLGYLLQWARNRLAQPQEDLCLEDRSAASGRFHQPPPTIWWLTQFSTAPFRVLQRPFSRTTLGTGFVAVASRPA